MYVLCTSKDMPYTAGMLAVLVLLLVTYVPQVTTCLIGA